MRGEVIGGSIPAMTLVKDGSNASLPDSTLVTYTHNQQLTTK